MKETRLPTVNRRTVLRSIGAGIGASALVAPSVAESNYETVVDIVDEGADDTGREPIDDVFSALARDDTLITFPEGRYKINSITVYGLSNFGMVGSGEAVLVPGEEYDPRLWIAGTNNRDVRIENFTIDNTEDGVGSTMDVDAYDGLIVRNVRKRGYHDVDRPSFGFRIIEKDGTGLVENLQASDGGTSVGIYTDPRGTITFRNCHIEGFANNGIYGVYGDGPVHIEGGLYKNNNVTSLRLSNPESSVTGATVVVEDPPEAFQNCRGIRISDGPGPVHIEDCEIRMVSGRGTGGIVCEGSGGSFTVQDTAIGVGEEYTVRSSTERTSYAIYVESTSDVVGTRTIENTIIKGRGTDLAAVRIARDHNRFRNVCLEQAGEKRSGILFLSCHGNTVEDCSITVPGTQIRLDGGSTVDRQNITTDTICEWPTSDTTFDGDTITVVGKGSTAYYEFSVEGAVEKSTAYDGTINSYDQIHDGGRVTGRTTNEPDSFVFTGDILDFETDAPVHLSINGEAIDPELLNSDTITIVGNGETAHYEFSVDGTVEKSTAYNATINSYDQIHDDGTVTGRTTNEPDSFSFTGNLLDFEADNDVVVYINGEEVDPVSLATDTITIVGNGETAHYEFSVDGTVEKSTAYGGTINGYDRIHDDGRVSGRTTNEPDSFAFTGTLVDFETDNDVTVYLNGDEIDSALLGKSIITIVGKGSTAHYEFSVDGAVEKSTAHGGTINSYDRIHDGGRVTGRTTNEPDSFLCTGIITSFEADAPVDIYIDGESVDLQ